MIEMNSQKKQRSEIKLDKHGLPLNFGNYKNGKLVIKGTEGKKGGADDKSGNNRPRGARTGSNTPRTTQRLGLNVQSKNSHAAPLSGGNRPASSHQIHQIASDLKIKGQPMSYWENEFVCAVCHISISGEISLAQHCLGKSHLSKAGFRGFAGLLPNEAGITPTLSPTFLAACVGGGNVSGNPVGRGRKHDMTANAVAGHIGLTGEAHTVIKNALAQNIIVNDDSDEYDDVNGDAEGGDKRNLLSSHQNEKVRSSVPDLRPPTKIQLNLELGKAGSANRKGNRPRESKHDDMGPMGAQRRSLPVFAYRKQLLDTIANNRVTVGFESLF